MNKFRELVTAGLSARVVVELLSVSTGLRSRVLIQVPRKDEAKVSAQVARLGLHIEAARHLVGQSDPLTGEVLLTPLDALGPFVGDTWSEFWVNSGAERVDATDLFSNPGQFLGYPMCCVRAYSRFPGIVHLFRLYLTENVDCWPEINRLAAYFTPVLPIPDYFPCSLGCRAARDHVRPLLAFARTVMPREEFTASWNAMNAPLVLIGNQLLWCSRFIVTAGELHVDAADVLKLVLPESLLINELKQSQPRMLPFVQWRNLGGIRIFGAAGTSTLISPHVANSTFSGFLGTGIDHRFGA